MTLMTYDTYDICTNMTYVQSLWYVNMKAIFTILARLDEIGLKSCSLNFLSVNSSGGPYKKKKTVYSHSILIISVMYFYGWYCMFLLVLYILVVNTVSASRPSFFYDELV